MKSRWTMRDADVAALPAGPRSRWLMTWRRIALLSALAVLWLLWPAPALGQSVPGGQPCIDGPDCLAGPDPDQPVQDECLVTAVQGCIVPGDEPTEPEPEPPPPPTPAEVEAARCPDEVIPLSGIGRDPGGEGLTGLETYLWADAVGPETFPGEIRGYPVSCTIEPYEWTWTTGDGGSYTRGHHGGPYPGHAAEHVYETRNEPGEDYTLTLTVRWRKTGSAGLTRLTTTDHAEPYHVAEVRSTLTSGG